MRKGSTRAAKAKTAKTAAVKTTETAAVKAAETVVEKAAETAAETVVKAEAAEKTTETAAAKTAETAPAAPTKKKTAAKKTVTETVYLQYLGKEINKDDLMKQVKEIWTKGLKKKVGDMKSVTLYLKPEENKTYYVINDEVTGSIDM